MGSWQHVGAPGALLCVAEGEALEVAGRHPGWAHVRRACGREEGWVPEGVLQLSGEVGLGVMQRTVSRSPDSHEMQLALRKGTAVKLISREDEWWLVDLNGVRGYVPTDAVQQLRSGDREFSDAVGVKPVWVEATEHREGVEAAVGPGAKSSQKPWTCGLWAHLASYYAGVLCCMLGAAGALSHMRESTRYPEPMQESANSGRRLLVALFSLGFGAVLLCVNWWSKIASSSDSFAARRVPVRACFFALCSLPMFASGFTLLAGISVAFVALMCFLSFLRDEVGSVPENLKPARDMILPKEEYIELKKVPRFSCVYWRLWWELQGVLGERPKIFLEVVWVIGLVVLGVEKFLSARSDLESIRPDLDEDDPYYEGLLDITTRCWSGELDMGAVSDCSDLVDLYKTWIPLAKLFGNGLNFNCSLVVLMVCQHFLLSLSKRSQRKGPMGTACRAMPTHKNLIFHKSIAGVIAVTSFAHTFCHYMAQSYTLTTFDRWGYKGKLTTMSIWATGAAIIMCIVVMYPVSREYVRKTWFEAFIYTHVTCASIFMVCLWWHAPHFYLWACVPVGLYLLDRYLRYHVASLATVKLLEVRWLPPVLQLVFEKPWHYRAGQYVWLCCPALAWHEKHPFTIASAPETDQLCLAIKCWPGGWTERLKEFLADQCRQASELKTGAYVRGARGTAAAAGGGGSRFVFEEADWFTGQVRRGAAHLAGSPERPLLQIDGPHAAPAMRYSEFEVVIFAAAGIGLTPASSTLKSLLQFRWRQDPAALPHSMYFVWLCAAAEVPAFEWFMEELADLEVAAEVNAKIHKGGPQRQVQMHLFVTRAPPAEDPKAKPPPRNPKPVKLHGDPSTPKRPYTQAELLAWMKHPKTKSDDMKDVLQKPEKNRPNQAGRTLVWNGRPQWTALFEHVKEAHRGKSTNVGVFFCGAPAIGKDLTRSCQAHSDKETHFRIMKESF